MFKDGIIAINFASFNLTTAKKAENYLINYFDSINRENLLYFLKFHEYLLIFDNCA